MKALWAIATRVPVLFPVHPRTRAKLSSLNIPNNEAVQMLDPQPYLSFLGLMARARLVLTDSGGIQEETTALRVPCITLRKNTERPSTVDAARMYWRATIWKAFQL